MEMRRGQKESLEKIYGSKAPVLQTECYHKNDVGVRYACFALDKDSRLIDNRYLVYDKQPATPKSEVQIVQGHFAQLFRFQIDLAALPPEVDRLAFTAASESPVRQIERGFFRLLDGSNETLKYPYEGNDFTGEHSIVIAEIYRKDDTWRLNAIGRGFRGGFKAIVEFYGGALHLDTPVPKAPSAPLPDAEISRIPLATDKVERMQMLLREATGELQYLGILLRNMFACVNRKPEVVSRPLRFVLVSDVSGSMYEMYSQGRMQRAVDKIFPLAALLTEDISMDFWAFGAKSRQFDAVNLQNLRSYTFDMEGGFERWMSMLNYQFSNEVEAMRDVMMIYASSPEPVFVIFLTDGRLSAEWEVEEILVKTSRFPLFWQFIGLHGAQYGILEHIDEVAGRYSANANFIKMEDIDDMDDGTFYALMLDAVLHWWQEVDAKKLLRPRR